jgi:pyridoxal 5'-phosphate synthase pdxT subunit
VSAEAPLAPQAGSASALRVGILASQGDFAAHAAMLRAIGAEPVEVRTPAELARVAALVIPGGESTTISKAIERDGLAEPIRDHVAAGKPILGTCAGMIVCDREHLGLADIVARRNAFGRQLQSFEADLEVAGLGPDPMRAVFIRAPWVESVGPEVEVLAQVEGHPVAVRDGRLVLVAFHPELAGDPRLHAMLMAMAEAASESEARA